MRKLSLKKGLIPLFGLAMSLLATAASAQITSVKMTGTMAVGTRILTKNEGDLMSTNDAKITVTGGVVANTVYQWKKNGVVLANQTASALAIAPVTPSDAGTYTCTVTRANSSADATLSTMDADSVCILQVTPSAHVPNKDVWFRMGARPPYTTYAIGTVSNIPQANLGQTTAKITAFDTTGYGWNLAAKPDQKISSIKWFRNGAEINATTPGFTASDFGWATNLGPTLQLTIANTSVSTSHDGDQYYCIVTNTAGSATTGTFNIAIVSSSAVPTFSLINSKAVPTDPATVVYDTMILNSKTDFLSIFATNAITYQWYKGLPPNGTAISNATGSSYFLTNGWTAADSGTYYVKMMNGTTASAPYALSNPIQIVVSDGKGITVETPTGNTTVAEMDTLQLTAKAKGVKVYENSYKWYRNGQLVSGQSGGTMNVYFTSIADTGNYTYRAFNEVDSSALSGAVKVSITREALPVFHNLKDVYDGVNNIISPQMGLMIKGEGSENLTVWSVIDSKANSVAPHTATAAGKTSYYLASSVSGQTFPAGKYTIRVTNADGTLVVEKTVEIK